MLDSGQHIDKIVLDGISLVRSNSYHNKWAATVAHLSPNVNDWISVFDVDDDEFGSVTSDALIRIREWVLLLRLFRTGNFFCRGVTNSKTNVHPDPGLISTAFGHPLYAIDNTDGKFEQEFAAFCSDMRNTPSWNTRNSAGHWFYAACEFFIVAGNFPTQKWFPMRMVNYWIAVESCVVTDNNDVTSQVKRRSRKLIGQNKEYDNKIWEMYRDLRSNIVHGKYDPDSFEVALKTHGSNMEEFVRNVLKAAAAMPPDLAARNLRLRELWSPAKSENPVSC